MALEGVEAAREGFVMGDVLPEIVAEGPLPEPPPLPPALPPGGTAGVPRELNEPPPVGLLTTGGWPFGEYACSAPLLDGWL